MVEEVLKNGNRSILCYSRMHWNLLKILLCTLRSCVSCYAFKRHFSGYDSPNQVKTGSYWSSEENPIKRKMPLTAHRQGPPCESTGRIFYLDTKPEQDEIIRQHMRPPKIATHFCKSKERSASNDLITSIKAAYLTKGKKGPTASYIIY